MIPSVAEHTRLIVSAAAGGAARSWAENTASWVRAIESLNTPGASTHAVACACAP